MSYLDVPRFHFAGEFYADPSTVNNTLPNYDPTVTAPPGLVEQWNPMGKHWFLFNGCTVRRALDQTGAVKRTSADDALVDGVVETTNWPGFAKLVDLDPQYQMASQIWGLELQVNLSSGAGNFKGALETATLRDLWQNRSPGGFAAGFGGVYQSVLTGVTWDTSSRSTVFDQLGAAASPQATRLSIKFVLYAYDADPASSNFAKGKVVGTIGPAFAGEPDHFLAGRRLADYASGSFGSAPFKVDATRSVVVIDLGNAVPETAPAGPRRSLGSMTPVILSSAPEVLPAINYDQSHYEETSGISEAFLTPARATLLASNHLGISVAGPPSRLIMAERPRGSYVDAEEIVIRLNPGESKTIDLVATEFGAPKSGQALSLRLLSGIPPSALTLPASVTTGANGRASVAFTAGDPRHPRPDIDGQLYFVGFYWGSATGTNQRGTISVLVFDRHAAVAAPTWSDVKDILEQYAKLYPFMTATLDLSDQAAVQAGRTRILATLNYPETDPRYMPVTRDLSRDKRELLRRWLNRGAP